LFNVQNPGLGSLNYRIRTDQPWVFGIPDVGTSFGELDPISISVNASGLGEGVHNATVAVEQVDGELVENIDVVLTFAAGSMTDLTAHLLADLRHHVPTGALDGGCDELRADVAFAKVFLVHAVVPLDYARSVTGRSR